jgi:tRNA pseudouridine38-40 synthase
MQNIKLTISYDGTNYCGWQRQNNAMTVQQRIEEACTKVFGQALSVTGASRTDTGVHALGQVATLQTDTTIPIDRIPYALNAALPEDIVVSNAEAVDIEFHPRYGAKQKTYQYKIINARFPIPQMRNYAEFNRRPLDLQKMQEAAQYFVGTHDFKTFSATGGSVKTTVRTILALSVEKQDQMIILTVTGTGFLYNMVRIITGTLTDVGLGKTSPEEIPRIITSKDRVQAGQTAPPQGLTLLSIEY